jgi:nitroreductase/dihydropteridine reductase
MSFLKNLEWRRAVKKFVPGPPIDTTPIEEAIVATPTSFGLQPYKVIAVRDQALKEKLREVSFNQPQVSDCDTLFVFCSYSDEMVMARAEEYITTTGAEAMRGLLMGFLNGQKYRHHTNGLSNWSERQTYIALGFALAAAAELQISTCPMEGFDPKQVKEILQPGGDLMPVAYLAVGHTTPGDDGTYPRFRFPAADLIERR